MKSWDNICAVMKKCKYHGAFGIEYYEQLIQEELHELIHM